VLKYLLSIDFKNYIDLLNLVDLKGFDLTSKEEDANLTSFQIMKVLKIILYQLGIYEERQMWVNKDFNKT